MRRYTRSIVELWQHWQPNAKAALHPMVFMSYEDHERVFAKLALARSRDGWAAATGLPGAVRQARAAQAKGDDRAAKDAIFMPMGSIAWPVSRRRIPRENRAPITKSQEMYYAALRYLPYAFERVEIPFKGKPGEGDRSIGYFIRGKGDEKRRPLLIMWAGIDTFQKTAPRSGNRSSPQVYRFF